MRKSSKLAVGLVALATAVLVPAVPASSADAAPMAYTVVAVGEGTCELATIDLTTGELTDLPAGPSFDACVADLAVIDGVVHGISQGQQILSDQDFAPAAVVESSIEWVVFSADGTPTSSPIFLDDITNGASLEEGGVAFGPAGAYFQAYLGDANTTCNAGVAICLLTYDPETGEGSPIGGSGLIEQTLIYLTDCTSGQYSLAPDDGLVLASGNRSTGAVSLGASLSELIAGIDCAVGGNTLYAIAGAGGLQLDNVPSAIPAVGASIGTLDPATGAYTEIAPLSDPEAIVFALAVEQQATPPTTPTTPAPAVAQAAAVAPTFTG